MSSNTVAALGVVFFWLLFLIAGVLWASAVVWVACFCALALAFLSMLGMLAVSRDD